MAIVLPKGLADIAATDSGKACHFKAGDILSHLKHLNLKRYVNRPFQKEFQRV